MRKIIDIKPPKEKRETKKEEKEEGEEKREIISPLPRKGHKKGWIFLISIFFLAIVFVLLGYFSFAKIEIQIKTDDLEFEKELTIDAQVKNLDFSKEVLPGQKTEHEKTISQEFPATGKLMKEKKAEGTIRICNNYDLTQTLVANTRLQPPSEKFLSPLTEPEKPWFLTTEKIVVSPGECQEVKVVAHSPGEKYNIGPSKFSIPGLAGTSQYTLIYGESSETMKGGAKSEVLVVSGEDLRKSKDTMGERVREEGERLIKENLSESYSFLDGVSKTEILETSFSATSGQEAEKFSCQLKIKAKSIIFLKKDLEDFVKNYIISLNPEKTIWSESLEINPKLKNFDIEAGKVFLVINTKAKIYTAIEETSFKKQIAKTPLQEVKIYLKEQPNIEGFKINLFPFWIKTLPENLERINLEIKLD